MITSTLDEGVLVLRLARPERRNALDQSMVDDLRTSLEAAAADDGTRAAVLTGEGAAFCAGADLGLLTEVALDNELLQRARALADDALRRAPQSYGLTKRVLLLAASADLASGLSAETIVQSLLLGTEDHAEGLQAAREDRSPSFTGR